MSRRRFFQTASGMAAAFLVMNQVYGPLFDVSAAEAADKELADERAKGLAGQFITDTHTHFLRDDHRQAELSVPTDRLAALKAEYAASGEGRSNLRYGYVLPRR